MALPKITDAQIQESGVQSLPDKLIGTASENKKKFDQLVQTVVKAQYNSLIEALEAVTGAAEVGASVQGVDATNIQGVLSALKALIDSNKSSQDITNTGVQNSLDNVYTKAQTDAKVKAVQDDVDGNESTQNTVNANVQTALGNRYTKNETDSKLDLKLDEATGKELVKTISFDSKTGVFTITTLGGKSTTIDTLIEKVPASFSLSGNKLVLTLEDGTTQSADLSAFIDTYTFNDGSTIDFSQSGKTITAEVKAGSVGKAHFKAEVMTEIEGYAERAEEAKEAAEAAENSTKTAASQASGYKNSAAESAAAAESAETAANSYANSALNSKNSASTSASAASTSASEANASKSAAAKSAENAATSATNAAKSESSAKNSETNAKTYADNASGEAIVAKRWAVGGTNTDGLEDTDNAKFYCEQAEFNSKKVENEAIRAESWAVGGTGTRNDEGITNAKYFAEVAEDARTRALASQTVSAERASAANSSARAASESAESASDRADKAKYWAVGYGYPYDAPSDTNNAKYWAEVARSNAGSTQGNWAQGDENKPDYIFNRTHYTDVISEAETILAENSRDYGTATNFIILVGDFSGIRVGGKYKVIWNGSSYTRVAYKYNNEVTIGNCSLIGDGGENTGEPFCLHEMDETGCTCYKEGTAAETITIAVEGVRVETVKQLDPKYIKDMYYTEYGEEVLAPTAATHVDENRYKLTDRIGLAEGKEYEVTVNGGAYAATAKAYSGTSVAGISLGNAALGGVAGAEDTGENFLIVDLNDSSADSLGYGVVVYFGGGGAGVTVSVATTGVVHKMPVQYLPEGIGGGSGADWAESDESSTAFVKNRTHYKETIEPQTIIEEVSLEFGTFGQASVDIADGVHFVVGEKYEVTWDGEVYTLEWIETDGGKYLGNAGVTNMDGFGDADTGEPFCIGQESGTTWVYIAPRNPSTHTLMVKSLEKVICHTLGKEYLDEALQFGVVEEAILPETTMAEAEHYLTEKIGLVVGTEYTVVWDGVEYAQTAKAGSMDGIGLTYLGEAAAIGGDFTGEPFFIMDLSDEGAAALGAAAAINAVDANGGHAVSILGIVTKTIDGKYLPGNVPYTETKIEEVFPETALTYVEDAESFVLADPIGLVAGKTYIVKWNGTEYTSIATEYAAEGMVVGTLAGNLFILDEGAPDTGEPFIIVDMNEIGMEAMGFGASIGTSDGSTEATMGITLKNEIIHKLDNKFLDVDWYAIDERIVLVAEQTKEVIEGIYTLDAPLSFAVGKEYILTLNGTEYLGTAYDNFGVAALLFVDGENETVAAAQTGESGIGLVGYSGTEATLSIALRALRKMPAKFLPEVTEIVMLSSTEGSTKRFKITVDDSGNLTATEITE